MRRDDTNKRIQEALAYLGKHQYVEATIIWRQLCEESMSKVISTDITDSAINVHTTALNLDMESLIAAARSKTETKAGQVSSQKCKTKEITSHVIKHEAAAHSAERIAVAHVVKQNKQKYETKTAHRANRAARKMAQPMHVA
jgi:hypothetical protein